MRFIKKTAALILCVLLAALLLCACGNDEKAAGRVNFESLRSYAQKLEKEGNTQAAAAVYELIAKGGGAEFIEKAHGNVPAIEKTDEIDQLEKLSDNIKGGNGK